MKNLLAIFAVSVSIFGCKENNIAIPLQEVGERKVLVEQLNGVRCQNCPNGDEELQSVANTLGDRLIWVTLHAAVAFDPPFDESNHDFRSEDCRAVADFLYTNGDPGAPAASIDRQNLDDFTGQFIHRPWKNLINERTTVAPNIGLSLDNEFNAASRELKISVKVTPDEPLTGEIRLSVYITEDSIVDVQQVGTMRVLDYLHRHVFRDAVSAPQGDDITFAFGINQPFYRPFTVTLPDVWDAKHCSVVAFIHRHGDFDNRQVLQAEEQHVKL